MTSYLQCLTRQWFRRWWAHNYRNRQYSAGDCQTLSISFADAEKQWLYDNRAERMDATIDLFDRKRREFHLDRYHFAAKRVGGKRVLDCSCGTGYGARVLQGNAKPELVIGVDIDEHAIDYAAKKHSTDRTRFLRASGDRLPLSDASFDAVVSFETIEHVPDDVSLMKEFYRVLKPGGLLIISTPNQWPLSVSPFHRREYDRRSFLAVMQIGFDCIEFYNQNSGSATPLNHNQPSGIVVTNKENEELAECYIAVCRRKP